MGSAAEQQLLPGLPGRKFLPSARRQLGDDPGIRMGISALQGAAGADTGAPRIQGGDKEQEFRSCCSSEGGDAGEPQTSTRDHSNHLEELILKGKKAKGSGKAGLSTFIGKNLQQRARITPNPPRAPWHRFPPASPQTAQTEAPHALCC